MRALTQLPCRIDDVVRAARDTESLVIVRVDHQQCLKMSPSGPPLRPWYRYRGSVMTVENTSWSCLSTYMPRL